MKNWRKMQFQRQTQTTAPLNVLKYPCWCFSIRHFLLYFKHLKEIINLLLFSKATYIVTFKLKTEKNIAYNIQDVLNTLVPWDHWNWREEFSIGWRMNFLLPQFYIYYFLCLNTIQLSRNRHNQTVWSPLTPILLFIMMVYQQGKVL